MPVGFLTLPPLQLPRGSLSSATHKNIRTLIHSYMHTVHKHTPDKKKTDLFPPSFKDERLQRVEHLRRGKGKRKSKNNNSVAHLTARRHHQISTNNNKSHVFPLLDPPMATTVVTCKKKKLSVILLPPTLAPSSSFCVPPSCFFFLSSCVWVGGYSGD
jgi:hypothetical protein